MVKVNIHYLGRTYPVEVDLGEIVAELYKKAATECKVESKSIKLVLGRPPRQINNSDSKKLAIYNLYEGCIVNATNIVRVFRA